MRNHFNILTYKKEGLLRQIEWVVYAKRPFAGPEAVLAYLSRYTHRVAIANSRLIALDERGVSFKWKDYRLKGQHRYKTMTLTRDEFIRCFLIHILPKGFHRIRHYGLMANAGRKDNLARAREPLRVPEPPAQAAVSDDEKTGEHEPDTTFVCPACGTPMIITETLLRQPLPRAPPLRFGGYDDH